MRIRSFISLAFVVSWFVSESDDFGPQREHTVDRLEHAQFQRTKRTGLLRIGINVLGHRPPVDPQPQHTGRRLSHWWPAGRYPTPEDEQEFMQGRLIDTVLTQLNCVNQEGRRKSLLLQYLRRRDSTKRRARGSNPQPLTGHLNTLGHVKRPTTLQRGRGLRQKPWLPRVDGNLI